MPITIGRRATSSRGRDEADEAPRGSRYQRNGSGDDDAPRRGRHRSEERDDDNRGSRSSGRGRRGGGDDERSLTRAPQRGWSGSKRVSEETSDYADRYKVPDDDFDLIAFLEDEPFDNVGRHFINELRGRKAFICPGKNGPYKCPLCKVGDKAYKVSYFLIVVFDENEGPIVKVWEASPGFAKDIETEQNSRAVGGKLSSVYFEVRTVKSDSGKGAPRLKINRVRESELDKWDVEPPTDDQWDELLTLADELANGYVKFDAERVLQDAADALEGMGD